MFMLDLFSWWYGAGWSGVLRKTGQRLKGIGGTFAVGILFRTLFAPWKRTITLPGAGFDKHVQALLDNLVSRCVGFAVRFFVLIAAGVSMLLLCVAGVLELVIWPLLPLLGIGLIVKGLV